VLQGIGARADRFANPGPGVWLSWSGCGRGWIARRGGGLRSAAAGADSLLVALAQRGRWTTARARAGVVLTAVAVGLVLGGRAGPGTLVYAAAIGSAAQWSIQLFAKESACHPSI
jgi:hypothetical protein